MLIALLDGDPVRRAETFHWFTRGSHFVALGMATQVLHHIKNKG